MLKTVLRKIGVLPPETPLEPKYVPVKEDIYGLPRDMTQRLVDGHRPLRLNGCLAPYRPEIPDYLDDFRALDCRFEVWAIVDDYLTNRDNWTTLAGKLSGKPSPHFYRKDSKLGFYLKEELDGTVHGHIDVVNFGKIELTPPETKALWAVARDCRARASFKEAWLVHEAFIYELNKAGGYASILNYQGTVKPAVPTKAEVFSDAPKF